jgi:hypothetical protein
MKKLIFLESQMSRKVLSVLLVAVLTVCYAHAQVSFGVRAGLSYLQPEVGKYDGHKVSENYYWMPGFQLGAVINCELGDVFAIQPGLLFAQQRMSDKYWRDKDDHSEYKSSLNYLQVPINFQFKLDLNGAEVFLQAGPYIGYGLGGKSKEEETYGGKSESEENKLKFEKRPDNYNPNPGDDRYLNIKPLDYGIGLGLGVQSGCVQIGCSYNIGLANLTYSDDDKVKSKMNGLLFNITFLFGN